MATSPCKPQDNHLLQALRLLEMKVASELDGNDRPEGWLLQNLFAQSLKNGTADGLGLPGTMNGLGNFGGSVTSAKSSFSDLPEAKIAYEYPMGVNTSLPEGTPKGKMPVGISLDAALPMTPKESTSNIGLPPGLDMPPGLEVPADVAKVTPPPGLSQESEKPITPASLGFNYAPQSPSSQTVLLSEVLSMSERLRAQQPAFANAKSEYCNPFCLPTSSIKIPEQRLLAKYCVTCGAKVDPKYITAKFCAYCGAEHGKVSTPSSPGRSAYSEGFSTSVGQASERPSLMSPGSSFGEALLHGGYDTPKKSEYEEECLTWGSSDEYTTYHDSMMWHSPMGDMTMFGSPQHQYGEFGASYSMPGAAW